MKNGTSTFYKIRQVIELTGASEFLLRAWELRYEALNPLRTKAGRRLYTEADILKARALLTLTQQGHRVGDIAHKNLTQLNQLLGQNANEETENKLEPLIKKIMIQANAFQWEIVRTLIIKQRKNKDFLNWLHSVIVPLLLEMGKLVNEGKLSIAQEHILSAIIKDCLATCFKRRPTSKSKVRVVFAAPEGDFHEIGISIASYIAMELKVNTLFLGPHMPKDELAAVCVRYNATHLVLSSTSPPQSKTQIGSKEAYLNYLNFLDRNLDPKMTFWLAGKNAQSHSLALSRPFKVIDSFTEFENEIKNA